MTLNASGFLGIGTTSPAERLSVAGAIMSTGGITGHGANRTTISQEGSNGAFWQSYGANTSTVGAFVLRQASSDFSIVRSPLVIASTGAATFSSSVGINGVGPTYPLYVRTGTNQRARFVDNGGLFQFAVLNDAESGYSDMSIGNSAIVVKSGGNVGIGTTAPASVLEVAGTSATTDFRISRTVSASTYFYISAPGGTPSTATLGVNGTSVMQLKSSQVINFVNVPTSSAGLSSGDIYSSAGVLMIV
jgi:hypothetical protein